MNRSTRIIDCLPPHKGEWVGPSFRLPWWAWLSLVAAVAIELLLS